MFQCLRRSKVLMRARNLINRVIFVLRTLEEIRDAPALLDANPQSVKHMTRNCKIVVLYRLSQIHQLFD